MASAMTRPVIWPSRVPIRVAAVPVLVGGVPLTGKTLCSICQVQSSPGSSADQLMLKVDELVVDGRLGESRVHEQEDQGEGERRGTGGG